MKTAKALTIIFGIAIGIIGLISTTVKADGKKEAIKANQAKITQIETNVYDAQLQETEKMLIEDYLQLVEYENADTSVTIVNETGATVFEGNKEEAAGLLNKSDYLFSFGEQEHYIITR